MDPVGTWNCLVYGHPRRGDERLLLAFRADGAALLTRSNGEGPWVPLSGWSLEDERMRFDDFRTGRRFQADLRYPTLGGTWKTFTEAGGWWCSNRREALADDASALPISDRGALAPLVPDLTASPLYPRQAIREAREGRAVVCFLVDSEGRVVEPEFIELTDEIFRASTLSALERSRYRQPAGDAPRPGCRTYLFSLDAVY